MMIPNNVGLYYVHLLKTIHLLKLTMKYSEISILVMIFLGGVLILTILQPLMFVQIGNVEDKFERVMIIICKSAILILFLLGASPICYFGYSSLQDIKLYETTLPINIILKEQIEKQYPDLTDPKVVIEVKQLGDDYQFILKKENKLIYSIEQGKIEEHH